MARTSNITFGQVAQIADAMKAAGTRPTARAVRERIGSGSMGTIHKLLQQWTGKGAAQEDEETEAAELPAHIQNALMDFIGTEIATACEPINEELQAAKEAAEDIAQDNERMHLINETLRSELDECRQQRAAAIAQLDMTRAELINTNIARDGLREQNTELLREIDRAQHQIEMLASFQTDLTQARAALAESSAARIEADRSAAVLTAQLEAANTRNDELWARFADLRSHAEKLEADAKQANNRYEACAARLEAAAREIESLRKPKPAPAKTPKAKPLAVKKPNGNS